MRIWHEVPDPYPRLVRTHANADAEQLTHIVYIWQIELFRLATATSETCVCDIEM